MCALTLFANEAACNFIRLKDSSLIYKEDTMSVVNSKNISQKYNLDKHSNVSLLSNNLFFTHLKKYIILCQYCRNIA